MKLKLATAFVVLFFASVAHADGLEYVNVVDVGLGGEALNMSFELDATTGIVLPNTSSITFDGLLSGTQWITAPTCLSGAVFPCSNSNLFVWFDAVGDYMAVGVYDFSLGSNCDSAIPNGTQCPFPALGVYPSELVQTDCIGSQFGFDACRLGTGNGFTVGHTGEVIVTQAPEPETLLLLALGLAALIRLARKYTHEKSREVAAPPSCIF